MRWKVPSKDRKVKSPASIAFSYDTSYELTQVGYTGLIGLCLRNRLPTHIAGKPSFLYQLDPVRSHRKQVPSIWSPEGILNIFSYPGRRAWEVIIITRVVVASTLGVHCCEVVDWERVSDCRDAAGGAPNYTTY